MTATPILLGPLGGAGHGFLRSGLRWLVPDGHACAEGEPIAYCSLASLDRAGSPFDGEQDLQVVIASPGAGVVRRARLEEAGAYLDRLPGIPWREAQAIGHLHAPPSAPLPSASLPRLLFLAGRRVSEGAEDRSGLMTGWHDRVRAWWGESEPATILAAGTCEQDALLRGDGCFREMFAQRPAATQIILWQDEPQVPCARTLVERIDRGDAGIEEIAADLTGGLAASGAPPAGADLVFAGAVLNALARDPLVERHATLSRAGVRRGDRGPQYLCLSLGAEFPQRLRHCRLGYSLNCHDFRLARLGPASRRWLKANFDRVPRLPGDVRADYRALIERLPGTTSLIVLNSFSTARHERLTNYRAFGPDALDMLDTARAKALNLVAHELAGEGAVQILDQDAVAAELGVARHLADGTHASGALMDATRAELVRLMSPGAPGVTPAMPGGIVSRSGIPPAWAGTGPSPPRPDRR